MATLIFDIETIGEKWESFDTATQKALSEWIEKNVYDKEERSLRMQNLKDSLGLSPLTGKIVAIGAYDFERSQGAVYYTGDGAEIDEQVGAYLFKQRSERQMLEAFWDGARSYDTFVTFNGRRFDAPFLMHRSAAHGIQPTQNLMEGRYPHQQKTAFHVDLQDALTFYGAMQRRGSLHLFCRAYGIESPKTNGVFGDEIAELFARKKFRDIASHCMEDVVATTELYKRYRSFFT